MPTISEVCKPFSGSYQQYTASDRTLNSNSQALKTQNKKKCALFFEVENDERA